MARMPQPFGRPDPLNYFSPSATDPAVSAAVVTFFNAVYAWMSAGLALTALVAWWVSTQPGIIQQILHGPIFIALIIAELILVFTVAAAVRRIPASVATVLFLIYAALNGLTLSVIFLVYAHAVLFSAFMVTAGTFGAMTVYGLVTRRDLSGMGSLLFMGLIGVVLASVVSMFWHNNMLTVIINYVGVLVFVGLTAYDTQRLKSWAIETAGDAALAARLSISGALSRRSTL